MEETPPLKLKEEKMDFTDAAPSSAFTLSSVTDSTAAAAPAPAPASPPAHRASPPCSSLPFMPVVIKQEPQSPVHVSSEPDPLDSFTHCAHSTTPELPVAAAAAPPSGRVV